MEVEEVEEEEEAVCESGLDEEAGVGVDDSTVLLATSIVGDGAEVASGVSLASVEAASGTVAVKPVGVAG